MSLHEIGFYVACRFTERKVQESLEFIWKLEGKSNKNFWTFLIQANVSQTLLCTNWCYDNV